MSLLSLIPILAVCTWVLFMKFTFEWTGKKAMFRKFMNVFSVSYIVFLFVGAIVMASFTGLETSTRVVGDVHVEEYRNGGSHKFIAHDGKVVVVRETRTVVDPPWLGYLFPVNGSGKVVDRKITVEDQNRKGE